MKELSKFSLLELTQLYEKQEKDDIVMNNLLVDEIARRLYVCNNTISYEDFKKSLGYITSKEEEQKMMIKRIDLYEE